MQDFIREALRVRFNVNVLGNGSTTLLFVHGFGCNQAMWTPLAELLSKQFRLVLIDLIGCGLSDYAAYDASRYTSLDGYVEDVLQIVDEVRGTGDLVLLGHSVGSAICLAASLRAAKPVDALVLVAPSPCFLNDADYRGGFERSHIDAIIDAMHDNREIWAADFASLVVGEGDRSKFARDFVQSFCSTHEPAALQFARLTFLVDQRAELVQVRTPTFILQSLRDPLAPVAVGEYMHRQIAHSVLGLVDDIGHSPHLTAPDHCAQAVRKYLASQGIF